MSEERVSQDIVGTDDALHGMLWICSGLGACSSFSETAEPPPPDGDKLLEGITKATSDSNFSHRWPTAK
jgi:hypothetical protein